MPVDFEPLYSASPPLFKHFGGGPAYVDFHFSSAFTSSANRCLGGGGPPTAPRDMSYPLPLRSCLIVRSADVMANGYGNGHRQFVAVHPDDDEEPSPPSSPTRTGGSAGHKKKVVFADDRGYALEHVKLMTEPSDAPPRWRDEFVERVTRGVCTGSNGGLGAEGAVAPLHWEPQFAQPASDYVDFRRRLERDGVCLENVMARDAERHLVGTVKVKNLSFRKEVVVRVSLDRWRTHADHAATYVPSGSEGTSVYDLYDTFSFVVPLPGGGGTSESPYRAVTVPAPLEFCVQFRCEGREYWDNNGGANYRVRASAPPKSLGGGGVNGVQQQLPKFEDAFTARLDSWAEFASWNHLVNDAPYW